MQHETDASIQEQIDELHGLTTTQLVERFAELHGYETRTRHRTYLIRKNAWRIQANAWGDLSERARKRAAELADDAEVRVMAPKTLVTPPRSGTGATVTRPAPPPTDRDPRIPPPGSAIVREYKGRTIRVLVHRDGEGFECDGERFKTLSAVATHVTGSHISGLPGNSLRHSVDFPL